MQHARCIVREGIRIRSGPRASIISINVSPRRAGAYQLFSDIPDRDGHVDSNPDLPRDQLHCDL